MKENFESWIAEVEAYRPTADALVAKLADYGLTASPEKSHIVGELPYIVEFHEDDAVVTIRIVLKDHNSDSDLVITNMTTLPVDYRTNKNKMTSKGYGSKAIQKILQWAKDNGMKTARATQVSNEESSKFWQKNGFAPTGNHLGDHLNVIESTLS